MPALTPELVALVETLVQPLVETAKAQIVEAARTATAEAVAEISAHMEQWWGGAQEFLDETRQEVGSLVRKMEEVRDNSAEVSARTERQYQEAQRASVEKFELVNQRAKEGTDRVLAAGEDKFRKLSSTVEGLIGELRAAGKKLGWKPWSLAAGVSLGTILLLTLLRPGWTMTAEQRRALRVGEAVIYTYGTATPAERAEMRRVNRWREPAEPDSTEAPPLPPQR
ncbi:MAG TPA: hypothetical protein VF746_14650 [Longimicrobium sp.]|jgi:hypothetical protein